MAIYEAQYVGSRILAWENYTSTATPLSAGNLNKIQATLEGIDTNALNAFNVLDQTKADKDTVNGLVSSVQFNDQTGVFTFGQVGGTSITINTVLEKVPASFAYDTQTEKLVIVNTDGTTVQVDLSTIIQQTEFVDSDTVAWTINADGTMSASVKDGSITDAKIQQHYLALVTAQANAANASATNAAYQALLAKSYANGTSNLDDRPTENVDNSYYFSQQSKTSSEDSEAWAVGQRNGTDIPSTDPAYENNAKYWAKVSEQMSGQSVFLGATSTANGFRGLVPDPLIADRNKVLKGDGTWGESEGTQQLQNDLITTQDNIADVEVSPAVAAHVVDEQIMYNNVLYTVMSAISIGDTLIVGTNIVESEKIVEQLQPFTGATNQNAGDIGTVPAPSAGDEDKVLQGSGAWGHKLQLDVVKQGNEYGYINDSDVFIPFKSQADIDAAVSAAKVGDAVAGDVRSGKTFTNATTSGVVGTFAGQEKTVTAGTSAASVTPDTGKWLSKVTYNPTPSQEKTVTATDSTIAVTPDSGKLLSKVNVNPKLRFQGGTLTTRRNIDGWSDTWSTKTWNGLTNFYDFYGFNIWTDGTNIYYSSGSTHYVLNKSTSTWSAKTWSGLTNFYSFNIWTDGDNIYYSDGSTQYVLNKSTSTWSAKTWNGLTNFDGYSIWTDGTNIYYSYGTNQYILNKSTSTWSAKTWNGLTNFDGYSIWTDGINIYYSSYSSHYVLNKSTSTWSTKTWSGAPSNFSTEYIWTDGTNIYYSYGTNQYVLDKVKTHWAV